MKWSFKMVGTTSSQSSFSWHQRLNLSLSLTYSTHSSNLDLEPQQQPSQQSPPSTAAIAHSIVSSSFPKINPIQFLSPSPQLPIAHTNSKRWGLHNNKADQHRERLGVRYRLPVELANTSSPVCDCVCMCEVGVSESRCADELACILLLSISEKPKLTTTAMTVKTTRKCMQRTTMK